MANPDLEAVRQRWRYLRDVPIKSNLDFARLGEQAFADMETLLDEVRRLADSRDEAVRLINAGLLLRQFGEEDHVPIRTWREWDNAAANLLCTLDQHEEVL